MFCIKYVYVKVISLLNHKGRCMSESRGLNGLSSNELFEVLLELNFNIPDQDMYYYTCREAENIVSILFTRAQQNELDCWYYLYRATCNDNPFQLRAIIQLITKTTQAELFQLSAITRASITLRKNKNEKEVIEALIVLYERKENSTHDVEHEYLTALFVRYHLPLLKPEELSTLAKQLPKPSDKTKAPEYTKEMSTFYKELHANINRIKRSGYDDSELKEKKLHALESLMKLIAKGNNQDLQHILTIWKAQKISTYGTLYNLMKIQRETRRCCSLFNPEIPSSQWLIDLYCPPKEEVKQEAKRSWFKVV